MYQSRYANSTQSPLRIVGVDAGSVSSEREGNAILVVVLLEGSRIVDIQLGKIEVDGLDAQRVLGSLLRRLSYDVVMLSGVSFGGFNLVDIKQLSRRVGRPVIAVIREKPNNRAVRDALRKHFRDWKRRWRVVRSAGRLSSCKPLADEPQLYFEVKGAPPAIARGIITSSAMNSRLPEPIRVAGIVAKGIRDSTVGLP
jgi:uncharacterized protein